MAMDSRPPYAIGVSGRLTGRWPVGVQIAPGGYIGRFAYPGVADRVVSRRTNTGG